MFSCATTQHIYLYKYCTNCTVCNWTVLTVITQKLLLHVQLTTAQHIYCTNCTVCNWTVLTVITQKLPLHVQLHNSTETVQLMSSEVECSRLFNTTSTYTDIHIQKLDPSKNSHDYPHCHNFTALSNTSLRCCHATTTLLNSQLIRPDAMN